MRIHGFISRGDHRLGWLLSSSAVGNLADGIGKVAFPLLATTLTRDPVRIGALSATQFVPWLAFGVLAGTMVDRIDRRRVALAANAGRAVVVGATAIGICTGGLSMWMIYVASVLLGTAETFAESASNALIPAVAGKHRLDSANSKFQAAEILGQTFLGAPVGSATFALFAAFPFLLDSAGFAIAAALMLGLTGRYRPKERAEPTRLGTDLAGGLAWLARNPLLRRLVLIAGLTALTSEFAQAQVVLYALDDLHLRDAAFGLFTFAGGMGGLAGAALAPRLIGLLRRETVLTGGILVAGLAFAGMGLIRQPMVAAVSYAVFAASVVAVNVVLATARHALVPGELLGRVLGAWRTVVWGVIPVGALLGGVLGRVLGSAAATFTVSGILQTAVAGFTLLALRRFSLTPGPTSPPTPRRCPSGPASR